VDRPARTRVSNRGPPRDAFVAHAPACSHQTIARMCNDPAVLSIEYDCLQRQLTTYPGAPWGLNRIDGIDDDSFDNGNLTGMGVRVYVVDNGVQGSHVDFEGRVVSGYTVCWGRLHTPAARPCPCCDDILRAHSPPRAPLPSLASHRRLRAQAHPPTAHPLTAYHPISPPSPPPTPQQCTAASP
jgi:hypothetical protein